MRWVVAVLILCVILIIPVSASIAPAGKQWTLVNQSVEWFNRSYQSTAVFDDKLWVIGGVDGTDGTTILNDTWYSEDGNIWYLMNKSPEFEAREYAHVLAFNNKMWIFGGDTVSDVLDDIYNTTDGNNWTLVNSSFFYRQYGYGAVVYDNKMWIMGGVDWDTWSIYSSDVYSSTDGIEWKRMTDSAAWGPRYEFDMIVFDGKMWVIGGTDDTTIFKDAWSSTDGITWTMEGLVPISFFRGDQLVVYDAGTKVLAHIPRSGIWSTEDMITWTSINTTPAFYTFDYSILGDPYAWMQIGSMHEFNGKLWLIDWYTWEQSSTVNDARFLNSTWYTDNTTQEESLPTCSDPFGILSSISATFVMISIGIIAFGATMIIMIMRGGRI